MPTNKGTESCSVHVLVITGIGLVLVIKGHTGDGETAEGHLLSLIEGGAGVLQHDSSLRNRCLMLFLLWLLEGLPASTKSQHRG